MRVYRDYRLKKLLTQFLYTHFLEEKKIIQRCRRRRLEALGALFYGV
jgi:hypothetical protein